MKKLSLLIGLISILSFQACKKDGDGYQAPTKTRMQGIWELTDARDTSGKNILNDVSFPVTAISLGDDNGMTGTQSPMFTRIVYGESEWISISSKINQAFDYANFSFSSGEFFVADGTPDRFTVEAKLGISDAVGGLKDILEIAGVQTQFLQKTIYHKFIDVKVTFSENSKAEETMVWEFDNLTTADYTYKDSKGYIVAWAGFGSHFTKGKFIFTKKVKTLKDIVIEHKQ